MSESALDVSVIICTQNRAASLHMTLERLASADREGIRVEVVIVDIAGHDNTKEVAESFSVRIPIRYLYEPTEGTYGKSHALNRALNAGGLGDLIAVLDDDISPDASWFKGVMALSRRWPDKDIFTGETYVVWPCANAPQWAQEARLRSWIFSALHTGERDEALADGRWFSGNHFWFRSRLLDKAPPFRDIWNSEAAFQLDLAELGFRGVAGPDAVVGHRIQPVLLEREFVLQRARKVGVCHARLRLHPYRRGVKQARLLHTYPRLGRLFCVVNQLRWRLLYLTSYLYPFDGGGFARRLIAVERITTYGELLRFAGQLDSYALHKRPHSG